MTATDPHTFAGRIYARLARGPSAGARADCAAIGHEADVLIAALRAALQVITTRPPDQAAVIARQALGANKP